MKRGEGSAGNAGGGGVGRRMCEFNQDTLFTYKKQSHNKRYSVIILKLKLSLF